MIRTLAECRSAGVLVGADINFGMMRLVRGIVRHGCSKMQLDSVRLKCPLLNVHHSGIVDEQIDAIYVVFIEDLREASRDGSL